ncbi:hypothetical protein [Desulfosporosinus sp. FKA]|uniref:hypothetical protein n=1 Tax=Desulfosporosinus sp. FKA TaxID=1969834 RepID=UPI000B4A08EA|nr:hypothetical protein [Desulfosporosinus sp. FKA]
MLSVRKKELFTNGLAGITCILMSVLDFFANKDILACIWFAIIVVIYVIAYIYQGKVKNEPWDELATENYAKARRFTLLFVELTLLIYTMIFIIGHFQVAIKPSHILFYYGAIKLVQTGTFLYYDSHIVE